MVSQAATTITSASIPAPSPLNYQTETFTGTTIVLPAQEVPASRV